MSRSAPLPALLLEVLACPRCGRRPAVDEGARELVCDGCRLAYRYGAEGAAMDPDRARPLR